MTYTSQIPLHQTRSQEQVIVCVQGRWKPELGGYHDQEPTKTWDGRMEKEDPRRWQLAASGNLWEEMENWLNRLEAVL
jgi:hypothetical protein